MPPEKKKEEKTDGRSALVTLPEPDLQTADGLRTAVASATARMNELIEIERAGRTVTQEEWDKVEDGWKQIATRVESVEDMLKRQSEMFPGGSSEFLLNKAQLRLDMPDGMQRVQRTYFNVVAMKFEELAGLSHLGERHNEVPGLSREVMRGFSSPAMSRMRWMHERLLRLNDELLITDVLCAPSSNREERVDLHSRYNRMKGYKSWPEYERLLNEFARAFDETNATEGLNWVPTILSAQMMDLVQTELRVVGLFPQVTMTSKTLDWPVLGGDLVAYLMPEAVGNGTDTPISASTAVTNKVQFTAQKFGVRTFASSEIIEDSVIGMVQFILNNAAKVLARGAEDCTINGETGGATMDGTTFNPSGGIRRGWKGLRYYALQTGSYPAQVDVSGAMDEGDALDLQLKMGVFGADPRGFRWIGGFRALKRIQGWTSMLTLDKLGPNASILSGQVAQFFGSPFILSEFVYDQQTTGKYGDGTLRNFGTLLGVHPESFGFASRRAIGINASTDRYIEVDQSVFVGTARWDFEPFRTPSATVTPVGIIFDFT